jgi:Ca2+-binding EF-hand superfamily protein
LGQKRGTWTEELNKRCIDKIDTDKNGRIDEDEFVRHFNAVHFPLCTAHSVRDCHW